MAVWTTRRESGRKEVRYIPRAGDTLEHPVTGERMVFLKTARDTDGELLQADFFVKGGGFVAAEHVHPYQEERFEVLSGTVRFRVRGQERDVGAGETIVVPAGTPHVWWNASEDEAHLILEVRPALRTETFFETFFGPAQDGKVNSKNGLPNPLQLAFIAREYEDEMYLARPPPSVQRILFGLLASIGKVLGYKARYPEYCGTEEALGGREGERPSVSSWVTTGGSVVAAVVAVLAFLLFRRRSHSSRRQLRHPASENPRHRKLGFRESTPEATVRTAAVRLCWTILAPLGVRQEAGEGKGILRPLVGPGMKREVAKLVGGSGPAAP
jgi:quercetin dioxygenase-like cupin family protein